MYKVLAKLTTPRASTDLREYVRSILCTEEEVGTVVILYNDYMTIAHGATLFYAISA